MGIGPRLLVGWMVPVLNTDAAPTVTTPSFVVSPGLVSEYPTVQCSGLERGRLPSMTSCTHAGVTPASRVITRQ